MELLLIIGAIVAGLIFLPQLLSKPETKLFRRVWSSERTGGSYAREKQMEAIDLLCERFGIKLGEPIASVDEKIGNLLEAAFDFDNRNRINAGIQVTPIIASNLANRLGDEYDEIAERLAMFAKMDVLAFNDSFLSAMNEMSIEQDDSAESDKATK